ncbi:MAG: response regulator [Deltaproteobacteria bacterium]|nr:response regulator [Deltaproteobacteria bacterium]
MNLFSLLQKILGLAKGGTDRVGLGDPDSSDGTFDTGNYPAATPHDVVADQLIEEQRLRGVKGVSRVTLIACALSLPFPFGVMILLDFCLGLGMLCIAAVVGIYGAIVLSILAKGRYYHWMNWIGVVIEVSIPTAIALMDAVRIGPAYALTSAPVMLYGLAVLLSALRLRPGLVLFAGALGAVQMLLLYAILHNRIDADLVSQLPSLAFANVVQRATYILLAGIIGWVLCRSLLRLARDLSTQWLARQKSERQRRALEEQLYQAQKMEAIGQLAGGIAHDFNNLLTTIIGCSELIEKELVDPESLQDILDIRDAGHRAADLTSQLLAFSRKQTFQTRVVDLNVLVSNASRMLARLVGDEIQLRFVPADYPLPVDVDVNRIEGVLINLVVNARDAIKERDIRSGEVTIAAGLTTDDSVSSQAPENGWVFLSVTDNGVGMTTEMLGRIFEPFYTTKAQGKGTGLGLATAYGSVTQLGGHLIAESTVGKGSSFKTLLPAADGISESSAAKASSQLSQPSDEIDIQPKATRSPGGETVLVVEDESDLRRFATRALRNAGYFVLSAEDAADALETAAKYEGRIHLLLTDVVMPGKTGRELWEALQPQRPGIRLLYMSGYARNVLGEQVSLDFNTPLLSKPFGVSDLVERVRSVLDSS